jgi:tetratricopeptide (TPR) repeat protein
MKKHIGIFVALLIALPGAQTALAQPGNPEIKHALQLIELGNPAQAVEDLTKIVTQSPKDPDAHGALAIADLAVSNVNAAQTEAQTAFDLDRKSILARTARAMVYGKQGKTEDAIKEFNQAIKLNENEIGTYLAFSRYYLSIDSNKQAEVLLYQAQAKNANDVRSYLGLAELYEKQRIFPLAIDQYESAKKIDPKDITVLAKLAGLYHKTHQYDKSVNEWIKVAQIDSSYAPAYYEIGSLFLLAGEYPRAASFAQKYLGLKPDDVKGNWLAAQALTRNNQFTDALPYLQKVSSNDSLKALSQLLLAQSYFFSKDFAKANAIYQSATNLSSLDQYYYGRSLFYASDTTHAINELKLAIVSTDSSRTEAEKAETINFLASIYQLSHRYQEAGDLYAVMATQKPKVETYLAAAQLYSLAGRRDTAIDFYNKAVALDPNSITAYIGLGTAYLQKDPTLPAMKDAFTKVCELATAKGDNASLGVGEWGLGQSELYAKNYDASIAHLKKALTLLDDKSPYMTNTIYTIGNAYLFLKDYPHAVEQYKKVLVRDPTNTTVPDQIKKLEDYMKTTKGKKPTADN